MAEKAKNVAQEIADWFPNLDRKGIDDMMSIIGPCLASLPGGDEFEDLGYPTLMIGWEEFDQIGRLFNAIQGKMDIEDVAEVFFHYDEEED